MAAIGRGRPGVQGAGAGPGSRTRSNGVTVRIGALVLVLAILAPAPPAGSWSNGTDGCNSFGTHDWILKKAIRAAGEEASWVRMRVALRATDDPDCKDGIDHASGTWWHVYDEWGDEWGGADEATRVWFRRMKRRLEGDRERATSRALGIMSHFVADVGQPMHTDSSKREDRVHGPYEEAVDRRIPDYPFRYDGRDAARPAARTRRVARQGTSSIGSWCAPTTATATTGESTASRSGS
jgi:hypothetical protein